MRILTVPADSSILHAKSRPVGKIDRNLVEFMKEMGKTLRKQRDPEGVGLSAIQVNNPVRIFALNYECLARDLPWRQADGKRETKNKIVYYVNPEIVWHSKEKTLGEEIVSSHLDGREKTRPFLEGCLSIPDLYGEVHRWTNIRIRAAVIGEDDLAKSIRDLRFKIYESEGLTARVIQHEMDHLNGILFTDLVVAEGNRLYRAENKEMIELAV